MINFGRWLLLYSAMPFKGFPRNGGGGVGRVGGGQNVWVTMPSFGLLPLLEKYEWGFNILGCLHPLPKFFSLNRLRF